MAALFVAALLLLASASPAPLRSPSSVSHSPASSSGFPLRAPSLLVLVQARPLVVAEAPAALRPLGASARAAAASHAGSSFLGRPARRAVPSRLVPAPWPALPLPPERRREEEQKRAERAESKEANTEEKRETRAGERAPCGDAGPAFLSPFSAFPRTRRDTPSPRRLGSSIARLGENETLRSRVHGSTDGRDGTRRGRLSDASVWSLGAARGDWTRGAQRITRSEERTARPLQLSLRIETLPIRQTAEEELRKEEEQGRKDGTLAEKENRGEAGRREENAGKRDGRGRCFEERSETRPPLLAIAGEAMSASGDSGSSASPVSARTETQHEEKACEQRHGLSPSASAFSCSSDQDSAAASFASSRNSPRLSLPTSWLQVWRDHLRLGEGACVRSWLKARIPTALSSLRVGASVALFFSLFFPRHIVPSSLRRTQRFSASRSSPCASWTGAEDRSSPHTAEDIQAYSSWGAFSSALAPFVATSAVLSSVLSSANEVALRAVGRVPFATFVSSKTSPGTVLPSPLFSSLLFIAASLTDLLDGYLARRWEACSSLGALLDALADKLLVTAALGGVCTLAVPPFASLLGPPAVAIFMRELAVQGLRLHLEKMDRGEEGAVQWLGKVKTAVQMGAVSLLLLLLPLYTGSRPLFEGAGEETRAAAGSFGALDSHPELARGPGLRPQRLAHKRLRVFHSGSKICSVELDRPLRSHPAGSRGGRRASDWATKAPPLWRGHATFC
ncbi:putative CDP-alcohol phosphatidyltransferase domain-containing protein [Neospora caninum Liverpool]|uniref:Putative CDP-alcohol phosphatidyltransferase domain-containing protein n=1 Tax=Neospora caninum (strain Liverpool) TaxID=572307 RepID=F0V9I9_NEOCL|nr:putative CDP-alcohol phosphatidyltransferase domain-containing protein [Neospora caninum Liverpool]CBZ50414.1 putative CDP-alcohol phosphatidyltransferase domain-containing protein [Neospora caninum Liverpool]|eukprot:XP_003880448.1 putative CDP-alcohol phosphatidyltransferase domain-containing protein [Neospora caninum Liverpool]